MTTTTAANEPSAPDRPRVADLTLDHPWQWVEAGWKDLRRAPGTSIAFGVLAVASSWLVTLAVVSAGMFFLIPPLAAGFFLLAPLFGMVFYAISRGLERGVVLSVGQALVSWRNNHAHIAAMGVLLGGHAFDVEPRSRLLLSLWLTIGTGIALGLLEAGPSLVWFHQGRGLATLVKLGLLCAVPFCWDCWYLRVGILLTVVALGSVGSHMRARYRYYSVIHRQVIPCGSGPGATALAAEEEDEKSTPTRDG